MLDHAGDVTNFPRATGGRDDVKILRQCRIAGSHAEDSCPRSARPSFGFTNGEDVFAGGQMRDGDGEIFSINFLVKRRRIIARAFDG